MDAQAAGSDPSTRSSRAVRTRVAWVAVWAIRLLPILVLVDLWPDLRDALSGAPGGAQRLSESAPVVLGVGALRTFAGCLAVTPLQTLFGWRWHLVLRRDLGRWAFGLAALDLVIAAANTPGGVVTGVAGHAFLAFGTLATVLLLPLALTSNGWAKRRLGRYWKRLHMLVYPVVPILVVHLLLLPDGPGSTLQMTWLFGPSMLLRVRPVRRRVVALRLRLRSRWARRAERPGPVPA